MREILEPESRMEGGFQDETIKIFRAADRLCAAAGKRWDAGERSVTEYKDIGANLLQV